MYINSSVRVRQPKKTVPLVEGKSLFQTSAACRSLLTKGLNFGQTGCCLYLARLIDAYYYIFIYFWFKTNECLLSIIICLFWIVPGFR